MPYLSPNIELGGAVSSKPTHLPPYVLLVIIINCLIFELWKGSGATSRLDLLLLEHKFVG